MIISKKNITGSTVIRNIVSLSVIQIGNYLLPFITLPYLSRILGPDNFGVTMFAQSFINYFTLLINFGFDYSVTREIANIKGDINRLSDIFSNIIAAKCALFILSTLAVITVVAGADRLGANSWLYLSTHMINIGFVLFPQWFLQGMQKLAMAGVFSFTVKLLYSISIFLFIKKPAHYLLVNLLLSVAQIIAGVLAFWYCITKFSLRIMRPSITKIMRYIKDSTMLFLSQLTINLYTNTNIFLLGLYTDPRQTGLYASVTKIWLVIQGLLLVPFNQSFFPHISQTFHESVQLGLARLKKIMPIISLLALAVCIVLYFTADFAIVFVFGEAYRQAGELLRIVCLLPLVIALSNIYGIHGLLPLKADRIFLLVTAIGAGFSVVMNLLLLPKYGMYGATWVWLVTEILITALCMLFFKLKTRSIKI